MMKRNSKTYLLTVIGTVSAFGPFITDFYLPALPALNGYFHTTASLVQLSLTFGLVGLGVGQLVIGPLSDKYGRKRPLILSLAVFCLATLGCLLADDIYAFLCFRLLQGLAGAGGVVISRSIATDLYEGKELTRFFSLLSSVQGLAPICAPVLGGLLLEITDWKGIFRLLLLVGVLLMLVLLFFRESLPHGQRRTEGVASTFRHFLPVLRNGRFMYYVSVQAFAMGVMFTYIAASPYLFQSHYGLSPVAYSLCFGANALAIMLGSLSVSQFGDAMKAMRKGTNGFSLLSIAVAGSLVADLPILTVECLFFIFLFFLGIILPSSTTLALDMERGNSGSASALLGFLMFLAGGVLSPLAGLGEIRYTTGIILVACCAATWLCSRLAIRAGRGKETGE